MCEKKTELIMQICLSLDLDKKKKSASGQWESTKK